MSADISAFTRGVVAGCCFFAITFSPAVAADTGSAPAGSTGGADGSHPVIGDGSSLLFSEGRMLREFELRKDEIYVRGLTGHYQIQEVEGMPTAAALVDYVEQLNTQNEEIAARLILHRKNTAGLERRMVTENVKVQLTEIARDLEVAKTLAEEYGVTLRRENVSINGWILLRAEGSIDAIVKAAQIAQDERVLQAGPKLAAEKILHACDPDQGSLDLNDPLFSNQWYYNDNVPGVTVGVQPVWLNRLFGAPFLARYYTGRGVTIGVLDSGVETEHEDLDPNMGASKQIDFVDGDRNPTPDGDDHGTKVGGLAAARGGNGIGMIGAAPRAELVGLRWDYNVPDAEGFGHASSGIEILNNSWGYSTPYTPMDEDDMDELEKNVDFRDRIFTFASGNAFEDDYLETYEVYPNSRYTISVGAVNFLGIPCTYSSSGPGLFIMGIASDGDLPEILSTTIPNAYTTNGLEGTSFACPMVSGITALMLEARPELSWRDVQAILRETANGRDPLDPFAFPPFFSWRTGWGLANAAMACKTAEWWPLMPSDRSARVSRTVNDELGGGLEEYYFDFKGANNPNMIVEHVELEVEWKDGSTEHPAFIEVTSPTGIYRTGDLLSLNYLVADGSTGYNIPQVWTYTLAGFWGENSTRGVMNGVWRVRVGGLPSIDTDGDGNGDIQLERILRKMTLTIHGTPFSFPPAVTTAVVEASSDPGNLNPRAVANDDDIIVSGVEVQDFDLDTLRLDYQWQVQINEDADFVNIPGQSGAITDICQYPGPKADFTISDYPIRRERRVDFDDISKAGCDDIVSWDWDFGDGNTSTQQNPSHTYDFTTPGAVVVTLTVTNSNGGVATFAKQIAVLDHDDPLPINLPPLAYNDPPIFTGGQNFIADTFVLPGSLTEPGASYRLVLTPSDEDRQGQLFLTEPAFVLATPPGFAAHGEEFLFESKLPIIQTPPYELPPYVLVNEFSQGDIPHPANGEWIEVLTTVDVDLRNFSIANNLVTYDTAFGDLEYWRRVPAGTLITIYNDQFRDYTIPPDDFDYSDGFLVLPANSELLTLPNNGDGWGEFPNFSPAFVAVWDDFCVPVSGVSFNDDDTFVELNEQAHGQFANDISQHEAAWVTIGSLLGDPNDPIGSTYSYQSSWVVGTAPEATPGAFNSAANQAILGEISDLLAIVDPGNGTGVVNTVPEYSYSPLIPGITINPETGVMSGIPDLPEGGQFDVTITRSLTWDSFSQTFTITVLPASDTSDTDFDGVPALAERGMGMNNSVADAELLPTMMLVDSGADKKVQFNFRRHSNGGPSGVGPYIHTDGLGSIVTSVWMSTDLKNWTNLSTSGGLSLISETPTTFPGTNVTVELNQTLSQLGGEVYLQLRFQRVPF